MTQLIDITLPISSRLPIWPGDPAIRIERVASLDSGDVANVSLLESSVHVGTHIDAPLHFLPDAAAVDAIDLDRLVGPCWVAELSGAGPITAAQLEHAAIPRDTSRLLLKTSNSLIWEQPAPWFDQDYRALTIDAARWLVDRQMLLVGIDALSIEPFAAEPGYPVHRHLLQAQIAVVEGLRLGHVAPGGYQLCCLPLKITGADGAPLRAILAPLP